MARGIDVHRYIRYVQRHGSQTLALRLVNKIMGLALFAVRLPRGFAVRASGALLARFPPKLAAYPGVSQLLNALPRRQGPRRYICPRLGIEGFFNALNQRRVRYVILRWFDDLPEWPAGEDIDLLVHDDDLQKTEGLFVNVPRAHPVDLYSITAQPGSNYRGLPYYPPHLAEKLLSTRVLFRDRYYVPEKDVHFLSLAYHAVYHKGQESGLPDSRERTRATVADHDYTAILTEMADKLGYATPITFEDLHRLLAHEGWSPPVDTLRKLAMGDPWLERLLPQVSDKHDTDGELIVLVIRQWAIDNHQLDFILGWLDAHNFDTVRVKHLTAEEVSRVKAAVRGGEWGRGPYPVSGGPPSVVVVMYDYHPTPSDAGARHLQPHVRNSNVLLKNKLRDAINNRSLRTKWTNCVHSSDDTVEAWQYINVLCPEFEPALKQEVQQRRAAYRTVYPVIANLSRNNRRAKVEKIVYKGDYAVKKTFKKGRERFADRERYVYGELSSRHSCIPPLLAAGTNYLIIPWYENVLDCLAKRERRALIRKFAYKIVELMKFFYDQGYALVNFYEDNLIITPDNKLLVVDFEFLYKYREKPASFLASYDVAGLPRDFEGDLPSGTYPGRSQDYGRAWRPIFGCDIERFINSESAQDEPNS